jgi:putative tricarboxylic transport membrane protein
MGDAKKREFVLGIIMLIFGLGYLLMTSQLPRKQTVDASFIPYVLGSILCMLGVLQLRAAGKLLSQDATAKAADSADYPTVWKTVGLIVVYVALLDRVGFPIMTVLYLFAQFIVLTPVSKKINYVAYGLVAVISSASIFLTFRYALDLMLPVGLLN